MTHLDHLQLVDALDGASTDVESHLRACADCRGELESLQRALASVRSDRPAEPSPLFWEHFAARVNARIDTADRKQVVPENDGGWMPHALAWAGVLALVLAVVSIIVAPKRVADPTAVSAGLTDAPADPEVDQDEAWAVIRELATDFDYDAARAAGVAPGEGVVDRAASELNDAERAELARLIDAELKRMGP